MEENTKFIILGLIIGFITVYLIISKICETIAEINKQSHMSKAKIEQITFKNKEDADKFLEKLNEALKDDKEDKNG